MKLDHVAVYVRDLEKTRAFYEKYFGAKANKKYHNTKTGLETYFLTFDNDTRLEIMTKPEIQSASNEEVLLTGYVHIAITLGSKEKVDEMTALLSSQGYEIASQPRTSGDGYYESCILDPDGNKVELLA